MSRVGEAVARQVGAELGFMMDLGWKQSVFSFCDCKNVAWIGIGEVTSFQMTVSDSPVVLEVPMENINLRSHATKSSLRTCRQVLCYTLRTAQSPIKQAAV